MLEKSKKRVPFIVGNWKMHKTAAETREYIDHLSPLVFNLSIKVGLAVPYTDLFTAAEAAIDSNILIGAQNVSDVQEGALTGEISAPMIAETGADFVIIGHSERRRLFHETGESIHRKIKLALQSKLQIIFCIGESKEQREHSLADTTVKKQLYEGLKGITASEMKSIFIAYEPVWAIGNNQAADPVVVEKIHHLCHNYLANDLGLPAENIQILYGGSVNAQNAKNYLTLPSVQGLLVGGASLDVQTFVEIIYQAEKGLK